MTTLLRFSSLRFASCLAIIAVALAQVAAADDDPQYEVVWVDGVRETVAAPPLWIARERQPTLGDKPALAAARPLRNVFRLGTAAPERVAEGVELIGGDRLTGRVVEYRPEVTEGIVQPASLVVEPRLAVDEPLSEESVRVRVPLDRVRRVIWEESTYRPFRPGTFFYRDGRRTTFRSLRWSPGVVRLLVDQGVEEAAWDDAAEVHLPERDPWEEYADQLAVLTPDLTARLVRFATPGGARITTSVERLRAVGDVATPESQRFELWPAWSLDPIVVPQRLVSVLSTFAPHEVPLSKFEPSAYVHRSFLAGGWNQWRADLNVQGNPPAAADREFAWGLGVQGYAALEFTLPAWAKTFRTWAALDRAAGDGGSARGRIYFGPNVTAANPGIKPLHETPVFIGTGEAHDSGRLELRPAPGRTQRLVLLADSLPNETGDSVDPLDLRDVFDWLEPLVELDPTMLKSAVAKHAASIFVRRHRWIVQGTYGDAWRWENAVVGGQSRSVVAGLKSPLIVSRTVSLPADCEQLLVYAATVDDAAGPVTLKLVIAGQAAGEAAVPKAGDAKLPSALRLPVPELRRGREVKCELHFLTTKPGLRLDFHGVELRPPE